MNNFNPNQLTLARKKRKLTKVQLANELGLVTSYYSLFESMNKDFEEPSQDILNEISRLLKFPSKFFYMDNTELLADDEKISIRASETISEIDIQSAIQGAQLSIIINRFFEGYFTLPKTNLLDLSNETPQLAVDLIRKYWKLGNRPIKNCVHLLESKGIRIFSLEKADKVVGTFSFWLGETPYIILNTFQAPEQCRFDLSRELGHLLLHKEAFPQGYDKDKQASIFASAFLMPEDEICGKINQFVRFETLLKAKKYWKVSLVSLIHRLKQIKVLKDWRYHSLMVEALQSDFGYVDYHTELDAETSLLLPKVFNRFFKQGISKRKIAKYLGLSMETLDNVMTNLVCIDNVHHLGITKKRSNHIVKKVLIY
ncbi:ImmA/IrrE family metallo-endopeptidase [Thiotrichales bacterium 19X7-9]|nr:ImmA/IrrE family metallo-endopeptidase [Thiotrichales bacterium 19X7-9]